MPLLRARFGGDQWMAWIAAWLGWTLDAFDFTIFLLIIGRRGGKSKAIATVATYIAGLYKSKA